MRTEEDIGLTTKEALSRLHGDLKQVLYDASRVKTGWFNSKKSLIYDTLHHHSQYTTICWTSTALLLISVCALAIAYNSGSCGNYNSLPFDILIIFILVLLNLGTVAWDNNLRLGEVLTRAKQLLDNLEKSVKSINWSPLNYPNLCTPASPCITLQWTYRDGEVVNLPWALLVRGDVIIVRPGQTSPGYCIPFDVSSSMCDATRGITSFLPYNSPKIFLCRIKMVLFYMLMKFIVLQFQQMNYSVYHQPGLH